MADDRSEMEAARLAGLAKRQAKRLARADLAIVREAIEELPATCHYHGDNLVRDYGMFRGDACCDTGKTALARRKAEEALRRLEE